MFLIFMIWYTADVRSEGPRLFRFSIQPKSQTVENGADVSLSCKAENGQLQIKYSWYQMAKVTIPPHIDGRIETSNQTLRSTAYRSDLKLLYQCCAESENQIIFSDVAKISISYFEFRGKSVDRHLTISDPESAVATALSCFQQVVQVTSSSPFQIIWYRGADRVDGINGAKAWMSPVETTILINIGETDGQIHSLLKVKPYDLVLYNLVLTDSTTYFCKAVQGKKMVLLSSWTLQVRQEFIKLDYLISKPVIGYLTDSVNVGGVLNNQVTTASHVKLLCGGIGYCDQQNKLTYSWYRDGHVISKGNSINASENGRYTCAIKCGSDGAYRMSSVTVPRPIEDTPSIEFEEKPPEYIGYIIGRTADTIEIPCSIGDTARFKKTFYLNGEQIDVPIPISKSSEIRPGVVQCSFIDKLTETVWEQRSTQLAIIGKPTIKMIIPSEMSVGNDVHVFPKQSVTFSFKVQSLGPVQVTLFTDGKESNMCTPGGSPHVKNEQCHVTNNTYTITINDFTASNERKYTLRALHEFYLVESGAYRQKRYTITATIQLLQVERCNTTLDVSPKQKVYSYGENVSLACNSLGHPEPKIQFYKDGQPLGSWESSCKGEAGRSTCNLLLSGYHDNGVYSCHVYNTIRGQKHFCNTTSFAVTFVGDPTITSVDIRETETETYATCTAEGNPAPKSVYWLTGLSERVDTNIDTISPFRVTSTLNVTEGLWPYQCCVKDLSFEYCYLEELTIDEYEVFNPGKKGMGKIFIVGIVAGGILLLVFISLVVVIGCKRYRAKLQKSAATQRQEVPLTKVKDAELTKEVPRTLSTGTIMRVRPVSNPRYAHYVH